MQSRMQIFETFLSRVFPKTCACDGLQPFVEWTEKTRMTRKDVWHLIFSTHCRRKNDSSPEVNQIERKKICPIRNSNETIEQRSVTALQRSVASAAAFQSSRPSTIDSLAAIVFAATAIRSGDRHTLRPHHKLHTHTHTQFDCP